MFPDGIDDRGREVNVEITQKHDAVVILRENERMDDKKERFIVTVYSCEFILIIYC